MRTSTREHLRLASSLASRFTGCLWRCHKFQPFTTSTTRLFGVRMQQLNSDESATVMTPQTPTCLVAPWLRNEPSANNFQVTASRDVAMTVHSAPSTPHTDHPYRISLSLPPVSQSHIKIQICHILLGVDRPTFLQIAKDNQYGPRLLALLLHMHSPGCADTSFPAVTTSWSLPVLSQPARTMPCLPILPWSQSTRVQVMAAAHLVASHSNAKQRLPHTTTVHTHPPTH